MSLSAMLLSVGGVLALIGAFSLWLWRTPYNPPPDVHRDYRRPGDPLDPADQ